MSLDNDFWPSTDAFLAIENATHVSDGSVRCTAMAVCDEKGQPSGLFYQGQTAHFFYEFEVLSDIGIPSAGLEFHAASGNVIYGKNSFQMDSPIPGPAKAGDKLRFHHCITMNVCSGDFAFGIGLVSTDDASFRGYRDGILSHEDLDQKVAERCRVTEIGSFTVAMEPGGKLSHHGITNLPDSCSLKIVEGMKQTGSYSARPAIASPAIIVPESEICPTIFHITHWKAGSQWVRMILKKCVPDLIVTAQVGENQFLHRPLQQGKVYTTVYVTRQQFESVRLPPKFHRFVVIRDLRDTLVSAYFSMKVSHPVLEPRLAQWRATLNSLSLDDGLIYMMDEWIPACARVTLSWAESKQPIIRYEDLLEHDIDILEPLLIDEFKLPVSRERLREVVLGNRFERQTGRAPGEEDITAHNRKGISGDWRNYFSERVKWAFKMRYGGVLIASGYEKNLIW